MPYGFIGSMRTQPGKRDEVVALMLSALDALPPAGCLHYTVGASLSDDATLWASEVWESKEHHDASRELPEVKALIARVMPMLTGDFTSVETAVRGGLYLRPS